MQWQEFRSHFRHLPTKELGRIEQAFLLGARMHDGQKRRSGEPYFTHPIAVAEMLSEIGADADTIIAALLHDTVEDTTLTLKEIDKQFDGGVAPIIDGVTKLSSKDVAMSPKLDEQIETLRKIFTLMQQDVRIMVIKLIDRLHNMQTVTFLPVERQKALARETFEVFVKIADKLCMQDLRDELEGLCLTVLEPELHKKLTALRMANEIRGNTIIDAMHDQIRTYDRTILAKSTLHFEYKTWEQLKSQLSSGDAAVTGVSFVTAAFTCPDIDSCYRMLGVLHQLWQRETLSFQDFINAPQLNGYRGLHTTIISQDGTRVRCKIRTKEMQEYARRGIATKCFDSKAIGLPDYLPWTKRISPLATDTKGSSDDFWQNLKSDILGETIVIHGPDDSMVQLPHEATALDGAFYLLQENALCVQSIRMNGIEVPFSSPLQNAAALDISLADHITCNRDWLRSVQTGFAAAKIRITLAKQSEKKKIEMGKELLQGILSERKKGFLEEFSEEKLKPRLQSLGYRSMTDVFASIGDGRLEPIDVFTALFEDQAKWQRTKAPSSQIRYKTKMDSVEMMDRMNLLHRTYGSHLEDIRYHRTENGLAVVTLKTRMPPSVSNHFRLALSAAGATSISEKPLPNVRHILVIILLVFLWGLDPVLAKSLMTAGIAPATFTVIRAWTVLTFAFLVLLVHGKRSLVRIPIRYTSLWIAGISLFCVNALTYLFLQDGSPLLYNTMLRINAVILAAPLFLNRNARSRLLLAMLMCIIGFGILLGSPFGWKSIASALLIVMVFSVYTFSTTHFQTVARVHARYAQLFAYTSFISAIASLSLGLFSPIHLSNDPFLVMLTIGFCLIFIAIPYTIFHAITENFGYATLSPWINATVLITLAAQVVLTKDITGFAWLIPAAIFLTSASLLASKIRRTA